MTPIIAAIFIALWAVTQVPTPPPARWIVNVVAALVAVLILLAMGGAVHLH